MSLTNRISSALSEDSSSEADTINAIEAALSAEGIKSRRQVDFGRTMLIAAPGVCFSFIRAELVVDFNPNDLRAVNVNHAIQKMRDTAQKWSQAEKVVDIALKAIQK